MHRTRALEESLRLITEQRADEAVELVESWYAGSGDPFGHGLVVFTTFLAGRHDDARRALAAPCPPAEDGLAVAFSLAARSWLDATAETEAEEGSFDRLTREVSELSRSAGADERSAAFVRYLAAEGVLAAARLDLAQELLSAGPAPRLSWTGHPYAAVMLACDARVAIFSGRIDEAQALLASTEAEGLTGSLLHATAAVAAANAADSATVQRLIAGVEAEQVEARDQLGRGIHMLLSFAALTVGDRISASAHLLTAGGDADLTGLTLIDRALGYEMLVAGAVDEGDLVAATSWLERAEPWAEHRAAAPSVERMRSRVHLLAGESTKAAEHAAQAVVLARAEDRIVEASEGEVVLARARIAADDVPGATQALRAAVADSDRTGHHSVRQAASRTLRVAGRRLPPVTGAGHAALSPRERDVADLILAGCESAEIAVRLHLSPATIRTHVSRVLAAYGVATRIGLLAATNTTPSTPVEPDDLTPQQVRVAAQVAQGHTNQQIAESLGISVKGVEKHVGDILGRWRAGTRFGIARTWWDLQG